MSANKVDRSPEKVFKEIFQAEHEIHFRRHIDTYIHIAVRLVVSACHRAEQTQ